MEHLNVGSECVCSTLLTMFLVMSPIVTTVICQPEPNYHFNRFQQSRQILLVEKILLVCVKPGKNGPTSKGHTICFLTQASCFLDKW